MTDDRAPRQGDMIFLATGFTYVGEQQRDHQGRFLPVPALGDGCFEVIDEQGEAFLVVRAPERDEELRSAVHDDGRRRAWRATVMLRPFTPAEIAALDRAIE